MCGNGVPSILISLISGPGEEEGIGGVIAASLEHQHTGHENGPRTTLPRKLMMPLVKSDRLGVGAAVGLKSVNKVLDHSPQYLLTLNRCESSPQGQQQDQMSVKSPV